MTDAVAVVIAFNEAINDRDLAALTELMTESHRFIDSAGATVDGRNACVEAWRGFFESFPTIATSSTTSRTSAAVSSRCGDSPSAASLNSTGQPSGVPWSSTLASTSGRCRSLPRARIEPAFEDAVRRDTRTGYSDTCGDA
jgi:ketosteroid isomerase-like protein